MTIKDWELYVDEDLRENYFKGGFIMSIIRCPDNSHCDNDCEEPSAQDIVDAVIEDERDMVEWKAELDERYEDTIKFEEEVDPYHYFDTFGFFPGECHT